MPALDPALRLLLRAALTLLFGWAAAHKLRDVASFRAAIDAYELLPPVWSVPAGVALIAAEVGVAAGLWLPRVAPVAAIAAALLLALYAGAIGVNLVRGRRDIDCGCAGPAHRQPISAALVLRNVVLAVAALAAALPAAPRALTWVDGVTVVAGVAALALLYGAADGVLANAPRLRALAHVHALDTAPAPGATEAAHG
jgi:hypothetical protein